MNRDPGGVRVSEPFPLLARRPAPWPRSSAGRALGRLLKRPGSTPASPHNALIGRMSGRGWLRSLTPVSTLLGFKYARGGRCPRRRLPSPWSPRHSLDECPREAHPQKPCEPAAVGAPNIEKARVNDDAITLCLQASPVSLSASKTCAPPSQETRRATKTLRPAPDAYQPGGVTTMSISSQLEGSSIGWKLVFASTRHWSKSLPPSPPFTASFGKSSAPFTLSLSGPPPILSWVEVPPST